MPEDWRATIAAMAREQGYPSAEAWLNDAPPPWRPDIPADQIHQDTWNQAAMLQQAMLPSFARESVDSMSEAEFASRGVEDYERGFGHRIAAKAIPGGDLDRLQGIVAPG